MKTAIKFTFVLICIHIHSISSFAQNNVNDSLYIKFEKNIKIREYIDSNDNYNIELSFTISGGGKDNRPTTYNFKVDNLSKNFQELKFKDIENTISQKDYENINILSLEDLSELDACDLFLLLADTKNLFLLNEKTKNHLIYKLIYISTQRGWEPVNSD